MTYLEATAAELGQLCQYPPEPGEWFCSRCDVRQGQANATCHGCYSGCAPAQCVAMPGKAVQRASHRCVDCKAQQDCLTDKCVHCGGKLEEPTCGCCGKRSAGRLDEVTSAWNCVACWKAFEKLNEEMRSERDDVWYV